MYDSTLSRFFFTLIGICFVSILSILQVPSAAFVFVACIVCSTICLALYRTDYLHPSFPYLFPWLLILFFSAIPISTHSRPLEVETYLLLLANMFAWMIGGAFAPRASKDLRATPSRRSVTRTEFKVDYAYKLAVAFGALYIFAIVNVLMAGYVPIVSLLVTGNSRYAEFGVPSVYGAFLAYANAIGCAAFYIFLKKRRKVYLALFLSVLLIHLAFVTRQNLATLLIEAFVIRSLTVRRFSKWTVITSVALALFAFSALGTLRSGDIKDVIGVEQRYTWIPTSLIWVYAYSYFNALNIDNTITASGAPFFDGYMWQTLLPTILRPEADHGPYLEFSSMNVSSYVFPVYVDIGRGVVLWTFCLSLITSIIYRRALEIGRFFEVATYGCLLFCALFSFFVDFWLYLPVIFQLVFFWLLQLILFDSRIVQSVNQVTVEICE